MEHGLIQGKFELVPRMKYVRNRVCDRVDEFKPDLVIFEDLANSQNKSFAKEIAGLTYMIRAEMEPDHSYIVAGTSQLKKFCCGSGGSSKNPVKKEQVMKDLFKRFGHDINDNNVADAIVLCYIGMAMMGDWKCKIDPQREVITKIASNYPHLRIIVQAGFPRSVQTVQEFPADGW